MVQHSRRARKHRAVRAGRPVQLVTAAHQMTCGGALLPTLRAEVWTAQKTRPEPRRARTHTRAGASSCQRELASTRAAGCT
eukprot:scaffold43364_cov108-Phaeocystis_antarctica.AAC.5